MRNETLITHKPIAIATTTFLLFQMAMLQTHILSLVLSRWMAEDIHAKHNQEFSGGKGHIVADLRKKESVVHTQLRNRSALKGYSQQPK
jgi:hypothetical protein